MSILLIIHSITRWLAVLAATALVVRLGLGLVKKQAFDKSANALSMVFSGLMDTQMLLGLLLLLLSGLAGVGFPAFRLEHGITMFLAVMAAHLPAMWKKQNDFIRTRNTLFAVMLSIVLVLVGVSFLGWSRWLHITGLF